MQGKTPSESDRSSVPEFYPTQAALAHHDIAILQHQVGPNGEIIGQKESGTDEEYYDEEDESSSGRDNLAFG